MNTNIEEKTPLNVELTSEQKNICDASIPEVVLYYVGNPNLFLSHLYESLSTMSWKFYLFNKNE
jgi:hypothetical protein